MIQIQLEGRADQGTQLAAQLLAAAFQRTGSWVHLAIDCDGGCHDGQVTAMLGVDNAPIELGRPATVPDHRIVLDPTLVPVASLGAVRGGGVIVMNAPSSPCGRARTAARVVAVDATAIAQRGEQGSLVGVALLGAFAAVTGLVRLEDLLAAVEADSPLQPREHVAACRDGYEDAS